MARKIKVRIMKRDSREVPVKVKPVPVGKIRELAESMLKLPQVKMQATNWFAPGIYMRELIMPAGVVVVGKEHRTEHLNVMISGRAMLLIDGVWRYVCAPYVCKSQPGTMKVGVVYEQVRWLTVHPNPENDKNTRRLESKLTVKHRKQIS